MESQEIYDFITTRIYNPCERVLVDDDNYVMTQGEEFFINGKYLCLTRDILSEFKVNLTSEDCRFFRLIFDISKKPGDFIFSEEVIVPLIWEDIFYESRNVESLYFVIFSLDLNSIFFSFQEAWALIKMKD